MIYVDLDDVVCETCHCLADFARRHYNRAVTAESMFDYDLRKSFDFDEATYRRYMRHFHLEALGDIPETPGACATLSHWLADGLDPVIVTGRPTYAHADTRAWLDAHGLGALDIIHVDKYATRLNDASDPLVTPFPALRERGVAFAIDDAPNAIRMICETGLCPFAIFSRPWNRGWSPPLTSLAGHRVTDWPAIDRLVRQTLDAGE